MAGWNFADIWEAVASTVPDEPAQMQGDRTVTWRDFDRRANALAADLLEAGLQHQAKVAAYLYNCPEYLESYFGVFKAGLVPVNTNYRYGPEEIIYLYDNADVEAVVFHAAFTDLLDQVRGRLPKLKRFYVVSDGSPEPDWAVNYEAVVGNGADRTIAPWGRSGDDILMLYTGGTTGMPKGVMWRQEDLFMVLGGGGNMVLGMPPAADMDELVSRINVPGVRVLPACPLMHGTGQWGALQVMWGGACIVTLEDRRFDPAELWHTVQDKQVGIVAIVGDAFAKPMLAELDANPGTYDLSSLLLIGSSGVMWSKETKEGLLRHHPNVILFDSLGSTEAVGMAGSQSGAGAAVETAKFQIGERVKVFTDDDREVAPGSGETGMLAVTGYLPQGYYKDPEKTARTFRTIAGARYSIPGDFATVEADGTITLLGRGSVVINTGGEKVFPEEVEEILKEHPSVLDAVCVGVPDERFGEAITAMVEPRGGARIDADDLAEHVKKRLARYKAPKHVLPVESIGRSPAGKVDYSGLRKQALQRLGIDAE